MSSSVRAPLLPCFQQARPTRHSNGSWFWPAGSRPGRKQRPVLSSRSPLVDVRTFPASTDGQQVLMPRAAGPLVEEACQSYPKRESAV